MKRSQSIVGLVLLASIGFPKGAMAQVVPDGTVGTTVNAAGNIFTINNGTRSGNNLFHSFSQFSVPTTGAAIFNNAIDVQNIFSRVTGNSASSIDGLMKANGTASLFLMNPNGIVFGPNAKLDLGGSFVGTTANSIKFEDSIEFSAGNLTANPLLSVKVPIGLQMGTNPGVITVQGSGHNGTVLSGSAVSGLNIGSRGLQVKSGKTLALVGGNLDLKGGLISADGGRIELISLLNGGVGMTPSPQGLTLGSPNSASLGNIQLTQRSLLSVRGLNPGSIQIQGNQINIRDGSTVLVQNQGSQAGGDLIVKAKESLLIQGTSPDLQSLSSIINDTTATGTAGELVISASNMTIAHGGAVLSRAFGRGAGGNLIINVSNNLDVTGKAMVRPMTSSSIISGSTAGIGKGGDVRITAKTFSVIDSGRVGTIKRGEGVSGDLIVKADTIRVISPTPPPNQILGTIIPSSLLSSANFGGSGDAGGVLIDTRILSIQNGGTVTSSSNAIASSLRQGNAGKLTINASEAIEVNGQASPQDPSTIGAAMRILSGSKGTGNAGSVTINTPLLTVSNGAQVYVENQGSGNAGTLTINADTLQLRAGGKLSAMTKSGQGGDIDLHIRDVLLLRSGSFINAEAGGNGNGGNIEIDAPIIIGLENSDIVANAFKGRGGSIQITTQSIFGLKYRSVLTSENDITASSKFGINGNVQVNTIGINPTNALNALPHDITDSSRQIADRCAAAKTSSFVSTGRGGIPQSPIKIQKAGRSWNDLRNTGGDRSATTPVVNPVITPIAQAPIIEASALRTNPDGSIELIAPMPSSIDSGATCAIQ